jgi:uncharacterized RDD family membrane protein YckC
MILADRRMLGVVLIAFDPAGQRRFATIEKACADVGIEALRIAQYYSSGVILEEVVRGICDAHCVLADLTSANSNVHYELGIAHALGKRAILLAEDPDHVALRFDDVPVHKLPGSDDDLQLLTASLRELISTPGISSPIRIFTGGTAVFGQRLLLRRIAGFLFDAGSLAGMLSLFNNLIELSTLVATAISIGLSFAYFILSGMAWRATLGQRLLDLEVIKLDRAKPSLWQLSMRPLAALLNVYLLGAGFFWAYRFPRHQAMQDFLTRTLVVRRASISSLARVSVASLRIDKGADPELRAKS